MYTYISNNNKLGSSEQTYLIKSNKASGLLLYTVIFLIITCKCATNTYLLFFSWSAGIMSLIYNLITIGLVFTLPVWFYKTCCIQSMKKLLMPLYFLLAIIIIKHILLIAEYGGIGFLSPSFRLPVIQFQEGFYFINLTRWLSIGSLIMWIVYEIDSKKKLNHCLKLAMIALLIPIILMLLLRPELIGVRKVSIGDINFGGGFWNIGVRAFLAFGWLWLLMYFDKSQANRRFFLFGTIIVVLSGLFGISRSILVAVFLGILFFILFNIKSTRPIKLLIIAAMCVSVTYIILGNGIIDNFSNRFSSFNAISTFEEEIRFITWKNYLNNINNYWLLGAPMGSYFIYAIPPKFCSPHSSPLFWFVQYGIFALISYIALLLNIVSKSKALVDRDTANNILIYIITYVCLTFINEVGYYTIESYIGIAFILSLINICMNNQSQLLSSDSS